MDNSAPEVMALMRNKLQSLREIQKQVEDLRIATAKNKAKAEQMLLQGESHAKELTLRLEEQRHTHHSVATTMTNLNGGGSNARHVHANQADARAKLAARLAQVPNVNSAHPLYNPSTLLASKNAHRNAMLLHARDARRRRLNMR
ncbi:hypothetical protein CYMTET_51387 [Cymbomonas tetramitiformis]|uniref:Uncharacterized protein n=1 Tax=Cymbomonas tetramitiformis TaxID=36881 RepID=A0AAE0ES61_9CHLO|nr:hypothetical protein CYMTET_51387 [Cymbomonas tetramitiformis]